MKKKSVETDFGEFELRIWEDMLEKNFHFSFSKGDIQNVDAPLVRFKPKRFQDTFAINDLGKKWSVGNPEKISKSEAVCLF
ncbi:MAG: hypothetical protein Ct9H90mP6_10890 [Gammaproteobacteria bacterium]|nr:MAG: hypothetical protein Ct9H90mP6_10890 [Gammaproteobacteria bacterium]